MGKKKDGIASNTLSLTQTAWPNVERDLSASSVLNLTDYALVQHKIKTVSSFLDLQQEASTQNILYLSASNDLNLTHSAVKSGTINVSPSSQLDLTHSARSALHVRSIEHQLNLQHSIVLNGRPIYASAINNLLGGWEEVDPDDLLAIDPYDPEAVAALFEDIGLRQEVSLEGSVHNVSAISYLSLSHQAAPTQVGVASSHLHLSQTVELVQYEIVESILNLQHEAICHKVQAAESVLELDHTVVVAGDFPRAASNQLNLQSVVTHIIVNFCDYTPGIGDGSFEYTPPSVIIPTLVRRPTTVLTWPYASPVLTLELRNPNFDNVEQFEARRVNRRTRGGTLDLYRDENWPKVQRLLMSFSWLCEDVLNTRTQLFDFLQRSIGQEIGLLDFESRQWKGILLTPSNAISEPKRNGHSFTLEFEGELV